MIAIRNLGKRFRLYDGPGQRALSWLGLPTRSREFWALRGVDLDVPSGRTFGIVGANGAGKSTLLKLVAGTLVPTEGDIRTEGRVAALLELGTGFHPEFTGRQNIRINGRLLGMTPEEIAESEREIVAFSELGEFVDQPIRTYSSGMVVRLGFSIAAASRPGVLIVDEALAVGDARFSQKCIRRIREFREAGCTILFVSHDAHAVTTLCDEAVLLDGGRVAARGAPSEVLEHYGALLAAKGEGNAEMTVRWAVAEDAPRRSGTFRALVSGVEMLDADGRASDSFEAGATATIRVNILFLARVANPTVGFLLRDHLGTDVFGSNTSVAKLALGVFAPGDVLTLDVRVPLEIGEGEYSLTVAVHQDETHLRECHDWADRIAAFRVRAPRARTGYGRALLRPEWSSERGRAAEGWQSAVEAMFPALPDPLDADESAPSPFLGGFGPVEGGDGAKFRWMGAQGVVAIRPAHARLAVAVVLPPHEDAARPVRVSASIAGGETLGAVETRDRYAVLEYRFPADALGRATLLEIAVDRVWREAGGLARELGLAVYSIRTLAAEEAVPTWDAMTRSTSSATSSAS